MAAEGSNLKVLRASLSNLATNLPTYWAKVAEAGYECCHLNDHWIVGHCNTEELSIHRRYLIEYAAEVLAANEPFSVLRDEFVCRSSWLNELKANRLMRDGSFDELSRQPGTRHLLELSPGWRKFVRVRESSDRIDRRDVECQSAKFVQQRAFEMRAHSEAISRCRSQLSMTSNGEALQAFFVKHLVEELKNFGADAALTWRRNQVLQRDERTSVVVFDVTNEFKFVLQPIVVVSAPLGGGIQGTLSVGFRMMTPEEIAAPKFEFKRDAVVHLNEMLPGKFHDYGRFDTIDEFCLNLLAWTAALRIVLPDAMQVLRNAGAPSVPPASE